MSHAPTAPAASVRPEPSRPMPARIGQVLGLVRTLIAYGTNLAQTLQQHAADPQALPSFAFVASIFCTSNVSLILARITRGLLRAAALEARLIRRAARGHQEPMSIRPPAPRKPRAARQSTHPRRPAQDPFLACIPTPEEMAAKVRRRSIGAVLVDICLDLGIVPEQMDLETWDELIRDLFLYHGKLPILLHRRESQFQRELRQRRGDPVATLTGDPAYTPVAGQPVIVFPDWPVPSPQSPEIYPPPLAGGSSREADRWGRGPGP